MQLYWVSFILILNGTKEPVSFGLSEPYDSIDKAKIAIEFHRNNHTVLSAWIDTFDENDKKTTVFHECYLNAVGNIVKPSI